MTLRWIDGFDYYSTAQLTLNGYTLAGSPTIEARGRFSGNSLNCGAPAETVAYTTDGQSAWITGAAVRFSDFTAGPVFAWLDGGTAQDEVRISTDGTLAVTRNGTVLTGGISVSALVVSTYYFIEWLLTISDAICAGQCIVRVNGVSWINVDSGQDTRNGGASASVIRLGKNGTADTLGDYDDWYVADRNGSITSAFLSDCRVITLFTSADGTVSSWSPSSAGVFHYSMVGETASPNSSVDYISSVSVLDLDYWRFSSIISGSESTSVLAVKINLAAWKGDTGTREIGMAILASGTTSVTVSQVLTTSQTIFGAILTSNPGTNTAWAYSTVSAAQFGVRLLT